MVEIERVLRREHALLPGRDNDFTLLDRRQFLATQQETTQILDSCSRASRASASWSAASAS
jgi:hypothetical protein